MHVAADTCTSHTSQTRYVMGQILPENEPETPDVLSESEKGLEKSELPPPDSSDYQQSESESEEEPHEDDSVVMSTQSHISAETQVSTMVRCSVCALQLCRLHRLYCVCGEWVCIVYVHTHVHTSVQSLLLLTFHSDSCYKHVTHL